jgi:hypothetical protein
MTEAKRREFSVAIRIAIVNRASDALWNIHCEKCGVLCKSNREYQIDHIITEAMQVDPKEKLRAEDGQLLCLVCHADKTKDDKGDIGLAKRQEAFHKGVKRSHKKKFQSTGQPREPFTKRAAGEPRIAREYVSQEGGFPAIGRDGTG